MSPKEATEILLKRREVQTDKIKKSIEQIFNSETLNQKCNNQETYEFIIEPGKDFVQKKAMTLFNNASKNLDLIANCEHVDYMIRFEKDFRKKMEILNKGVKIREIISMTEKNKIPERLLTLQEKKPVMK